MDNEPNLSVFFDPERKRWLRGLGAARALFERKAA
jgi:hypothetical protein